LDDLLAEKKSSRKDAGSGIISDQDGLHSLQGEEVPSNRQVGNGLKVSEKSFSQLFENMFQGYAACQLLYENGQVADFIYLNVNKTFEKLTGLQDVVGKKVSQVIPGIRQSNPELLEIYGRVVNTGQPEYTETYIQSLDTGIPRRIKFPTIFTLKGLWLWLNIPKFSMVSFFVSAF